MKRPKQQRDVSAEVVTKSGLRVRRTRAPDGRLRLTAGVPLNARQNLEFRTLAAAEFVKERLEVDATEWRAHPREAANTCGGRRCHKTG